MTEDLISTIAKRRADIVSRIETAAREAGRNPEDIILTAVSKKQPDDRIEAMLATPQRCFGENRVQEAKHRWEHYREETSEHHLEQNMEFHQDIHLRLIGPLQSNKAEEAVDFFDAIESVDRPKIAKFIASAVQKLGKSPELFIQVNTGEEPQKSGVVPQELDGFVKQARDEFGLNISGLMCIPPADEPAGPHFALLKKLAQRTGLHSLSMGMSQDFETAIRFGATHVRVGSALFGDREAV